MLKLILPAVAFSVVCGFTFSNTAKMEGHQVYKHHCEGCHGKHGEGGFGPNLCDHYWLNGNTLVDIEKVIKEGQSVKGMPAMKDKLHHGQITRVAHYVIGLRGTKPANAKAPEGKLYHRY